VFVHVLCGFEGDGPIGNSFLQKLFDRDAAAVIADR
jgi:hypothetical protein